MSVVKPAMTSLTINLSVLWKHDKVLSILLLTIHLSQLPPDHSTVVLVLKEVGFHVLIHSTET